MPARRTLDLRVAGTGEVVRADPAWLVIGGYTGSDTAAVQAHIDELAAIGVPPPPTVPRFYLLDPTLLTTDDVIEVDSGDTSGEAEPVVIRVGGRYFLGLGSDHTDRVIERSDVGDAKAACPKPIAATVVELDGDLHVPHWEETAIASEVDGASYQAGTLAALRPPFDVFGRLAAAVGGMQGDLVLFGGTVPLLASSFVTGTAWSLTLHVPGRTPIAHRYHVKVRGK